jgi:hypothetical protein
MSDDRPTAVALAGPPETWLATLRNLCRYVRGESPTEADLRAWVRERIENEAEADADGDATDEADADRCLEFLAALDVIDRAESGPSLGSYGRDFLDSHDERLLFETLVENAAGIRPLVEVLAIRPVTDVEAAELLSRELGADIEDASACRDWLVALGYADHEDGVVDLTETGRRLVDSDADIADGAASRLPSATAAEAAPSEATAPEASASEAPAPGSPTDAEQATDSGPVLPTESSAPAASSGADTDADAGGDDTNNSSLAARHDHRCMVCGDRRRQGPEAGYAEVHYLMPTAESHGGPAEAANAVVVCPNHRADFEHGLVRVDPQSLTVEHAHEDGVSGRRLRTVEGHDLGAQYLAYHNDVIADF